MSQKRVICVLGMHRSGTSLLAGCLHILGVSLGDPRHLLPAGKDNPTGFWEHARIHAIHERLLAALGRNWSTADPMPPAWTENPVVEPHRTALWRLCTEEFAGQSLWAFKDPRTCLLLPLWQGIFARLGVTPHYLIVLRHPAEVAASLAGRNGFPPALSLRLWLRHNLEAVTGSAGSPRLVVGYDRFLADWRGEVTRISRDLALPGPGDRGTVEKALAAFIQPVLHHHRAPPAPAGLPPALAEVHRRLSKAAAGEARALATLA